MLSLYCNCSEPSYPDRTLNSFRGLRSIKIQRSGIYAISLTLGRWAIVKEVPQMSAAMAADHLISHHTM